MFTGIIEKLAEVSSFERKPTGGALLVVRTGYTDLELGESVAVDGACLTVLESDPRTGETQFFVSEETLARTRLGGLLAERDFRPVNLERALPASGRLSGHIVQGHVDGLGAVAAITPQGEALLFEVDVPSSLSRYCVEKGSIALNGVSLTINHLGDTAFGSRIGITIIPHTWTHTNLGTLKPGDTLNVEADILAKHVERLFSRGIEKC